MDFERSALPRHHSGHFAPATHGRKRGCWQPTLVRAGREGVCEQIGARIRNNTTSVDKPEATRKGMALQYEWACRGTLAGGFRCRDVTRWLPVVFCLWDYFSPLCFLKQVRYPQVLPSHRGEAVASR